MSPELGNPALGPVLEMGPPQGRAEGGAPPHAAGRALRRAPQEPPGHTDGSRPTFGQLLVDRGTAGLLGHQGSLRTHGHPAEVLRRAPFRQLSPVPALIREAVPPQVCNSCKKIARKRG